MGSKGHSKKASSECVRVVVRCRPLSSNEISEGRQRIVDVDTKAGQIMVKNPKADAKEPPKVFTFDIVYDWNCTQRQIYDETARPIVKSVMEGYNGTIFAYGQTGTGKTHTMEGKDEPELRGITPNAFEHIFSEIKVSDSTEFLVRASFLEIYNEEIRDLLGKNSSTKLELKESVETGVYVKDLTTFVVKGVAEIRNLLQVGKKNRSVGATLMNQDSSRSHSIFMITIETSTRAPKPTEAAADSGSHIRVGKLNLVDLAGSERQSKTGATGERFKELTNINWSLSALGNVISALVDGKTGHIPYRDSKLTRLLQDSLGGNTRTVMVANVGPADYNFDETISTLRYANRAKNIKNKPRINEDPKDAMLREFQEEIARLRAQLQQGLAASNDRPAEVRMVEKIVEKDVSDEKLTQIKEQMRKEMEQSLQKSVSDEALKSMKAELEQKANEEMEALLNQKMKSDEEKRQMVEELRKQHGELQKYYEALTQEKEERDALVKKLKAMEEKLLHGSEDGSSESLVDKTARQEKEILKKQQELEEKKKLDEERQRKIAELEEAQLMAEEKYNSVQEEVEVKTKKLKKLLAKYQSVKSEVQAAKTEIQDMNEEFQREREDLLDSIRALDQQLKLKNLIIESFIPPEEVGKIMRKAHWDEEHEQWVIEHINYAGNNHKVKRPVSAVGQRRPVSDYARIASAMGDQNPRYRAENILNLELDMPDRTTYDFEGAVGNPRIQAALDQAFADDSEMVFAAGDRMPNVYFTYEDGDGVEKRKSSRGDRSGKRPVTAKRRTDSRPRSSTTS